jgi:hypothetical protein
LHGPAALIPRRQVTYAEAYFGRADRSRAGWQPCGDETH